MTHRAYTTPLLAATILVVATSHHVAGAPPPTPTGLTAKATIETQIALSWSASSGATSYRIYRGTNSSNETLLSTTYTITGTTFADADSPTNDGLPSGTTYYYQITAVAGGAESSRSSAVSVTTQPSTVATFTCTPGDSQVGLSWTPQAGATGYRIYRDTLGGVGAAANFTTTGTSITDTGLVNGTTYYYEITSYNAGGEDGDTGQTNSATPTGTSGVLGGLPTNLRATPGNAQVVLNWNPVSNATRYDIFRAIGSNASALLTSKTPPVITYTDTNLTNGTAYSYTIRAASSTPGPQTSPVTATPLIPGAPTGLTATAESGQVVLTWTATGTSYALYRGTASGTETLLDSGLTGNSFIDAGVTNGVPYYYKVQALNTGGIGAISTEVLATPTGTTASSSSGTVSFNLPGEPVQTVNYSIPDINRPIRAALMTVEYNSGANSSYMQTLANKYNAMTVGIDGFNPLYNFGPNPVINLAGIALLDYRWPVPSAQRIQAALTAIVSQLVTNKLPAHPEVANAGVILYGFSAGTDNANLAAAQSPMVNRILAIVQHSELDEDRYNPLATLDTAPHLFLASGIRDGLSLLNAGLEDFSSVTHDTVARGLATNQGAPFTAINNAGADHGVNMDHPFISIWLDSILSQRLPAIVPTTAAVSLPSWQNSSSWVGTYTVISGVTTSPWGSTGNPGVQLTGNAISTRGAYADLRPFTWLPSQNVARAWLTYANSGLLTSLVPVLIGPTSATVTAGNPFYYQITATNLPTSYAALGSNNSTTLPFGLTLNPATGAIAGTPTGSGSSTITISASNVEGSSTTALLTLTLSGQTTVTFAQWEVNNNFTGSATATPFNDGVPNLLKYAFDINPSKAMSAADQSALPKEAVDTTTKPGTTYLTLTYRTNPSFISVNISAQTSPDLVNWGAATPVTQLPLFLQTPIAGSSDVTTKVGVDVTGQNDAFVRLQVSQ